MTITNIVGITDPDQRAAVAELVAIVRRGGAYSSTLLDRLPKGRVEVHIRADTGGNHAVILLEDGVLRFHPLDAVRPGRMQ